MLFKELFLLSFLVIAQQPALAAPSLFAQTSPEEMKYFSEGSRYSMQESSEMFLSNLQSKTQLQIHVIPRESGSLLDGFMTDQKFEKAILFSVNRRVNPEYQQKLYRHRDGFLYQMKKDGQQMALFFYHFSEKEVIEILSAYQVRSRNFWRELVIEEALAEEVAIPKSNTSSSAPSQSSNPDYSKILKDSFKGCAVGGLHGANNAVKAPFEAIWSAGVATESLIKDPAGFWQRSVDDFKKFGGLMANFREYMGDKWASFWNKSPEEINSTYCGFLSSLAVGRGAMKLHSASTGQVLAPPKTTAGFVEPKLKGREIVGSTKEAVADPSSMSVTKVTPSLKNVISTKTKALFPASYLSESKSFMNKLLSSLGKAKSSEEKIAIIRQIGDIEIDLSKFENLKPADYNPVLIKPVEELYELVEKSSDLGVQRAAAEALVKYARTNSGGYKLGYIGRASSDYLDSAYYNLNLPDDIRRLMWQEREIRNKNLHWESEPFRTSANLRIER
jgi:hypothetical protein